MEWYSTTIIIQAIDKKTRVGRELGTDRIIADYNTR
jgi:hypothetical protein